MNTSADFDVSAWPAMPRRSGLLVTATDTGVGKTLIAGAIARHLHRAGQSVDVFKPVATGCRKVRGELVSQDAEFLATCADSPRMLSEIAPIRYARALAPNVAAAAEGRPIDLEVIFDAYRRIDAKHVIVEGIGGLLCPITDDFWVIHLARLLALPLVIVARATLGTINHTLLTLQAARDAGLTVAGVVINRYRIEPASGPQTPADETSGDAELAMETNPRQIAALGKVPILALVSDEQANSIERGTIGPDSEFAISQVDWARIADNKRPQQRRNQSV